MNSRSLRRNQTMRDPTMREKAEMKRVMNIMNKAIVSTSIKETNDLLQEMMELWTPQIEALERFQQTLSIKSNELQQMRKKLADANNLKDTLKQNTAFYSKAELARARHNERNLLKAINETETEITKFHNLGTPGWLNDAKALPQGSDKRLFTLIDLNLHRIEELVYVNKKRLIFIEESQESTEEVLRDYGSVNDLIERVRSLEEENKVLKEQEIQFFNDAIARRRKFAELYPICSRNLTRVFTDFIQKEYNYMNTFVEEDFIEKKEPEIMLNFDEVAHDQGFCVDPNRFETLDFGNTTEPEYIEQLVNAKGESDQLLAYRNILKQMDKTNTKIEKEINVIINRYFVKHDGNLTRIEKLAEANDRLLSRVHEIGRILDDKHSEVDDATSTMLQAVAERNMYQISYIRLLARFKKLRSDQVDLLSRQTLNKGILLRLYQIISAWGYQSLLNDKESWNAMTKQIYNQFHEEAEELRRQDESKRMLETPAIPEECHKIEPENANLLSASTLQQRLQLLMKSSKRSAKREKIISRPESSTSSVSFNLTGDDTKSFNIIDKTTERSLTKFFIERPRIELLHALALTSELAGFTVGVDKKFGQNLSKITRECLNKALDDCKNQINNFGGPFKDQINQLNIYSHNILVKAKHNISIQTDVMPRNEEEVQTNESGFPKPKGAKGKR